MFRFLILSFAILMAVQAPADAGPITGVSVAGQLNGGNTVSASVAIAANGQASGAGNFSGTNPANGYKWSYPFAINKLSTAGGKLTLTGQMVGVGYPVTLSATVPNGPLTFTYVVNGKAVSSAGTGVVSVK